MRIKVTVMALEFMSEQRAGKVKLEGKGFDNYTNMLYVYVPQEQLSLLHLRTGDRAGAGDRGRHRAGGGN